MIVALDTETTGLDLHHDSRPFIVTMCVDREDGSGEWENLIWEWDVDPFTRLPSVPDEDVEYVRGMLDEADTLVLQNAKFDVAALHTIGIEDFPWRKTEDTLIGGHLLYTSRRHTLDAMVLQYLGEDISDLEENLKGACVEARREVRKKHFLRTSGEWRIAGRDEEGMPSAKKNMWQADMWLPLALAKELEYPPEHPFWTVTERYAAADPFWTLALWLGWNGHEGMRSRIRRRGLEKIYRRRMKVLPIANRMERRGVTGSITRTVEVFEKFERLKKECVAECEGIARDDGFRLKMPKSGNNDSLLEYAFDKLELPVLFKTDTGAPSLDKDTIEEWSKTLDPDSTQGRFVNALQKKRKIDTGLQYMTGYARYWIPLDIWNDEGQQCWFRMHPSFNPTGTVQLRWSSSNPNCFDGDTEFLTRDGWVKASELSDAHEVAQYWKETGSIDFVIPKRVKYHFRGDLHHIKTEQQIDLLMTPDHRCLLQNRSTGKFSDVTAENFYEDYRHYSAGEYVGGSNHLSSEMVALICATQADGSYAKVKDEEYGIVFVFRKKRKIDRLRWSLDGLGITYSESVRGNGDTAFYLGKNEPIVSEIKRLMPDKRFGKFLLDYDRDTLDLFCSEFFEWDGESVGKSAYYSSIKENSDWVQIVWSLSSWRANLVTRPPTPSITKDFHYLNVTKSKPYSMTTNFTRELVPWDDWVYCVTVPSSYILVRRNGRVSVTGNCQNVSKQEGFNLRECFGPGADREWWSLDAQNIELRIPTFEAPEPDLVEVFLKPKEAPYYGSYHLVVFDLLYPDLFRQHGVAVKELYESTLYQWVKNGNFCLIYGGQKRKADATYHLKGAYEMVRYRFPNIAKLSDRQIELAAKRGYVETIPDRTVDPDRGYPIMASLTNDGGVLPTTPLNYHISGTAMWWTQEAMIKTDDQLAAWRKRDKFDAYMTLQVHDELVFDFPKSKVDPKVDLDREKKSLVPLRFEDYKSNLGRVRVLQRLMESCGEGISVPTPVGVEFNRDNWAEVTLKC